MPQLIKNIEANVYDNIGNQVTYLMTIEAEVQREDYINMNGFVAYIQDLSNTEQTLGLTKPISFGLKNKYNLPLTTLNINY